MLRQKIVAFGIMRDLRSVFRSVFTIIYLIVAVSPDHETRDDKENVEKSAASGQSGQIRYLAGFADEFEVEILDMNFAAQQNSSNLEIGADPLYPGKKETVPTMEQKADSVPETDRNGSGAGSGDGTDQKTQPVSDSKTPVEINALELQHVELLAEIYLPLTVDFDESMSNAVSRKHIWLAANITAFVLPVLSEAAEKLGITVGEIAYSFEQEKTETIGNIFAKFIPSASTVMNRDLLVNLQVAIKELLQEMEVGELTPFDAHSLKNMRISTESDLVQETPRVQPMALVLKISAALFIMIVLISILYTVSNCNIMMYL